MSAQIENHPEVFVSSVQSPFKEGYRTVLPPLPNLDGRFLVSDLMVWFDFMEQVHWHNLIVCHFFRSQLSSMPVQDAQRAEACIREIEGMMPIFTRMHLSLFATQQRCKDLCVMLCGELMVCGGFVDCIREFSLHIAGSAEHWPQFSQALVENNLSGQKDWRQANSPANWVKATTNNIAQKEYWVPEYAVDPRENKEKLSLEAEEVAELPSEALVERRYTQRSLAELEAAVKDDADVAEYLRSKIRYPGWSRDQIWQHLGWDAARGERVDRRYRRMRTRLRQLGAGIQCRYQPRHGLSAASFTSYLEPLWDGTHGRESGVWQHRDPFQESD